MSQRHCLDVSHLACPEPLETILEHLHRLKPGEFLHVTIGRNPALLYPVLEKRGFYHLTCEEKNAHCQMLIWQRDDRKAENAARAFVVASGLA